MVSYSCIFVHYPIFTVLHTAVIAKCIFQFYSHQSEVGNFSSPQFPTKYSEEMRCTYNFQGKEHETLKLIFHTFDLEPPFKKGCLTDYIDISTITIIGSKFLVGRYCGSDIPGSMLFMNPHAEIVFKTNHVIHGQGFHGTYYFQDEKMIPPPESTVNVTNCGGTVSGVGGVIVSPGFPYYFPKDVECIWLLRVDYHMKIYVRILKMQLYGSIVLRLRNFDFKPTAPRRNLPSTTDTPASPSTRRSCRSTAEISGTTRTSRNRRRSLAGTDCC